MGFANIKRIQKKMQLLINFKEEIQNGWQMVIFDPILSISYPIHVFFKYEDNPTKIAAVNKFHTKDSKWPPNGKF